MTNKQHTATSKYEAFKKIIEKETGESLISEHKFHPIRKWRFDFAIVDLKIAIEVEGGVWTKGRHTRGSGFINDTIKYNTATSMGWSILRFAATELYTKKTIDFIKNTIQAIRI